MPIVAAKHQDLDRQGIDRDGRTLLELIAYVDDRGVVEL
jgi:hypothetical protein